MDTLTSDTRGPSSPLFAAPELTALIVVWSRDEPEHIGEVLIPAREGAEPEPVIFGRAAPESDTRGGLPRAVLVRQRPGANVEAEPLRSAKISRKQLEIHPHEDGSLELRAVGKRPLLVNGREVRHQRRVHEGDVVELRGISMFLVGRRPRLLPAGPSLERLEPRFGQPDACGIIGESPAIWALRAQIAFVADNDVHTLVSGPSGTGKELVARAIHALSSRRDRAMVARNAATFPASLIDAELFGNIANYPNPGSPMRTGLIGAADGSTLFLDEIGELPHELQAHLLRVLDEGEYQRLGDAARRTADIRLIAATNRPLHELKHDFRARMPSLIEVPGLEARPEDIALLIPALIRKAARGSDSIRGFFPGRDLDAFPQLEPELVRAAITRDYTAHVRELDRMLWAAMSYSATAGRDRVGLDASARDDARDEAPTDPRSLTPAQIEAVLRQVRGVKAQAWPLLGLNDRFALDRLLKRHGIDIDVFR